LQELLAADSRPLFLLGESIGSGMACDLAAEMPDRITGLALVVPIARMLEVAQEKFPWLPVRLILRDRFDNIASLASYKGRVAVVIADSDEVVGATQGRKLYESFQGSKLLIVLEGAGHNSFDIQPHAGWFRKVSDFLRGAR
jgi:pimeloyl-ACP methyl ester carboxylesterase